MQESLFSLFSFIMGVMSSVAAYYIAKLIDRYLSAREARRPTERFWDFLFSDTTVVLSAHSRYFGIPHAVCWTSFGDVQSLRDFYLFFIPASYHSTDESGSSGNPVIRNQSHF
jgi:hypothetical protein